MPTSDTGSGTRQPAAPGPLPLLTAGEMRAWDERAIGPVEIPERLLMESAGRAVARLVHASVPTGLVVGLVGRGNNGGDALVALRTLRAWGRDVLAVGPGAGEPRRELLHGWAVPNGGDAGGALASASVVLDGLLGTGSSGAPRGEVAELIRRTAASGVPVVALDVPSGVDPTTGRVEGEAISADTTISFGAPKRGLLRFPGRERCGRLVVVEIGFPPLEPHEFAAAVITDAWAAGRLPRVPPDAHKGSQGRLLLVAGRRGMAGAAVLAGTAALRAGAGLVVVLSDGAARLPVQAGLPEAVFRELGVDDVTAESASARAIVVGPGLGTDPEAADVLRTVLGAGMVPILLDADALNLIAAEPASAAPLRGRPALLTPHPAEMGRLLRRPTDDVLSEPFSAAEECAERFGCAVLLKGAPSLVAAPDRVTLVGVTGHSGVATGGMGDTLAGVAGAFLAAGVDPATAAALALHYAGRAAERAGLGRSLLPRDVSEHLPATLAAGWGGARYPAGEVLLSLPAAR
jgi:ADP-dependent NAD(P)H-hydrate dehydratase / NAD(P)H-hydrate epimerase